MKKIILFIVLVLTVCLVPCYAESNLKVRVVSLNKTKSSTTIKLEFSNSSNTYDYLLGDGEGYVYVKTDNDLFKENLKVKEISNRLIVKTFTIDTTDEIKEIYFEDFNMLNNGEKTNSTPFRVDVVLNEMGKSKRDSYVIISILIIVILVAVTLISIYTYTNYLKKKDMVLYKYSLLMSIGLFIVSTILLIFHYTSSKFRDDILFSKFVFYGFAIAGSLFILILIITKFTNQTIEELTNEDE